MNTVLPDRENVTTYQNEKKNIDAWIQTFTGVSFNLLHPRVEDIKVADIAHALSLICRYTGHVRTFYSVAQHSLMVAKIVAHLGGSYAEQYHGLLHDAQEAYVNDIASPLKALIPDYKKIEKHIEATLEEALGLSPNHSPLIRQADCIALMIERKAQFDAVARPWHPDLEAIDLSDYDGFVFDASQIRPPQLVEDEFLQTLAHLAYAKAQEADEDEAA